jgi:hypothetical protein
MWPPWALLIRWCVEIDASVKMISSTALGWQVSLMGVC